MAFVYWIHLDEHTNVHLEGYVGITTMTDPLKRFWKHQSDARNPETSFVVHRAMNKYGDRIKFSVICECSKDEAVALEEWYRPKEKVGWNVLKGGDHPLTGTTWSDEQRKKFKETKKNSPPPVRNQDSTKRHIETFTNKHPLDLHGLNLEVWSHCLILFYLFSKGDSPYIATRRLGFSKGSINAMWKRFKGGWNPSSDARLISFIQDNPPTRTPDMSDVLSNANAVGVSFRENRYVAHINVGGKRFSKSFSVLRYGLEDAFKLAVEFRKELERVHML